MSLRERVERTGQRLHKAASSGLKPFGADGHDFVIQPPVSEAELLAFEAQHGVVLPDEYRELVLHVSAGGAGPAYGMTPFGEQLLPEGAPADFLATVFPHDAAINDESLDDLVGIPPGTIQLCHEGCGYMHFLVCNGPARGQMWIDAMVSDGGLIPLEVSFLEWFDRWLDSVLAGDDGIWWATKPDKAEEKAELRAMLPWWRR